MKRSKIIALAVTFILATVVNLYAEGGPLGPLPNTADALRSLDLQPIEQNPDFTFNVRVALYNIVAEVREGHVNCRVSKLDTFSMGGQPVGVGSQTFNIPADGNFTGTVVVEVKRWAGQNPEDGRSYGCQLALGSDLPLPATPNYSGGDIKMRAAPGTQYKTLVTGRIP